MPHQISPDMGVVGSGWPAVSQPFSAMLLSLTALLECSPPKTHCNLLPPAPAWAQSSWTNCCLEQPSGTSSGGSFPKLHDSDSNKERQQANLSDFARVVCTFCKNEKNRSNRISSQIKKNDWPRFATTTTNQSYPINWHSNLPLLNALTSSASLIWSSHGTSCARPLSMRVGTSLSLRREAKNSGNVPEKLRGGRFRSCRCFW